MADTQELVGAFYDAILALEKANEEHPAQEGLELAKWMREGPHLVFTGTDVVSPA